MKVAIMQPYFFPYIGYFQLLNTVDEFIVYDNIEYSKKGWISRNRILVNGKDAYISVPIRKDSDFLDVRDRFLAQVWVTDRKKMLNRINESYRKAPEFEFVFAVVEKCILFEEPNLFKFILHSLETLKSYLSITTPLSVSSTIAIDHSLKAEQKVLALCKERNATHYINPIGGLQLYDKTIFKNQGIELSFLQSSELIYDQLGNTFVPWLSIIDVMMFNSREKIGVLLKNFELK
jgi:hypothetical protein